MRSIGVQWHDVHDTVARLTILSEKHQLSQNDYKAVVIILDLTPESTCIEGELDSYELSRGAFLESVNKLADLRIIDICLDKQQPAKGRKACV